MKMASPGNRHCANCIGTLLFPVAFTDSNCCANRFSFLFTARRYVSAIYATALCPYVCRFVLFFDFIILTTSKVR